MFGNGAKIDMVFTKIKTYPWLKGKTLGLKELLVAEPEIPFTKVVALYFAAQQTPTPEATHLASGLL
jgi:hypothetical protein